MRAFDLSPLYRSTVGFDHLFDLVDNFSKTDPSGGYPPYNIERTGEDAYRISIAVAGFGEQELNVEVRQNMLVISGERSDADADRKFLHQGIAGRSFERRYQLADHVRVEGAALENGLLNIDLIREIPEAMRPRTVEIKSSGRKAGGILKGPKAA
ncbi:MAG: Hsp20 family protein [Pseudomonadota bacterium]